MYSAQCPVCAQMSVKTCGVLSGAVLRTYRLQPPWQSGEQRLPLLDLRHWSEAEFLHRQSKKQAVELATALYRGKPVLRAT